MGKESENEKSAYRQVCEFYMVNPPSGAPINSTVRQLMKLESVREVHVTEGDYGFIIKAMAGRASRGSVQSLLYKLDKNPSKAVSYGHYKK
jgi:hypothetical protein